MILWSLYIINPYEKSILYIRDVVTEIIFIATSILILKFLNVDIGED